MGFPVLFIHASAFRTGPGRISGIDDMQFDAFHQGLVGHKGAELTEGPVVQPVSLAFPGRNLVPDAGEIFEGNPGLSAFGLENKLFGDIVVDPRLKTMLLPGGFFQSPLGRLRLFLLKAFSSFLIPDSFVFDRSTGENLPLGIGGDVDDPEIDSQNLFRKLRLLLRNVADKIDEPFFAVFVKDKINFPFPETEIFPLMLSAHEGNFHAAGKGPQTDLIPFLEREDSVIVRLCRPFAEDMASCPVCPVGIGNFGNATDYYLRRKERRLPCFMVFGRMERILIEVFRLESKSGQIIAKIVARLKSLEENLRLIFCRFQFEIDCDLHIVYSILEKLTCQTERRSAFLPTAEAGGILR